MTKAQLIFKTKRDGDKITVAAYFDNAEICSHTVRRRKASDPAPGVRKQVYDSETTPRTWKYYDDFLTFIEQTARREIAEFAFNNNIETEITGTHFEF